MQPLQIPMKSNSGLLSLILWRLAVPIIGIIAIPVLAVMFYLDGHKARKLKYARPHP